MPLTQSTHSHPESTVIPGFIDRTLPGGEVGGTGPRLPESPLCPWQSKWKSILVGNEGPKPHLAAQGAHSSHALTVPHPHGPPIGSPTCLKRGGRGVLGTAGVTGTEPCPSHATSFPGLGLGDFLGGERGEGYGAAAPPFESLKTPLGSGQEEEG